MSSAEEQIRALRSENESLTAAAEVVAAVTEEYAADASRWRKMVKRLNGVTDIESAFNELSDASRRKDNRIERMASEASDLRRQLEEKTKRIEALEALNSLSADIEQTLRDQIDILRGTSRAVPASANRIRSLGATCDKCGTLLDCIDAVLRPVAKNDVAFVRLRSLSRVLFHAQMAVDECKAGIAAMSRFAPQEKQEVVEVLSFAKVRTENMRAWAISLPESANANCEKVLGAIVRIEQQVRLLMQAIRNSSSPGMVLRAVTKMQCTLLYKAANSLMNTLPLSYRSAESPAISVVLTNTISEIVSQELASSSKELSRRISDSATQTAVNQAEILTTQLAKKEEELGDAQVRVKVFEERLSIALHAKEEADKLRVALDKKESEMMALREELSQASLKLAAMDTSTGAVQQLENSATHSSQNTDAPVTTGRRLTDATVLEHALDDHKRRIQRTRTEVMAHFLADLSSPNDARLQQEMQHLTDMKSGMKSALLLCKRSAASSQVVRLDPKTLRPLVDGVSLSRNSLISSVALARRELENLSTMKIPQPTCQTFQLQNSSPQESIDLFSSVSRALNIIS